MTQLDFAILGAAIWCLTIIGAVVTDIVWPRGQDHNRNGSKYIGR